MHVFEGLIGKSLEAHVVLHVSDAQKEIMDRVLSNAKTMVYCI